jgi:hypothetical protein
VDAGDPPGVALAGAEVTADGVLALTECVPDLDGAVAGGGVVVVNGEGDGEDVLLMADKAAGGDTGGEVPQVELTVPGSGQSKLTVGAEDDILNEMGVTSEMVEQDVVVSGSVVLPGLDGVGEVPDQQRLVAGGGD